MKLFHSGDAGQRTDFDIMSFVERILINNNGGAMLLVPKRKWSFKFTSLQPFRLAQVNAWKDFATPINAFDVATHLLQRCVFLYNIFAQPSSSKLYDSRLFVYPTAPAPRTDAHPL